MCLVWQKEPPYLIKPLSPLLLHKPQVHVARVAKQKQCMIMSWSLQMKKVSTHSVYAPGSTYCQLIQIAIDQASIKMQVNRHIRGKVMYKLTFIPVTTLHHSKVETIESIESSSFFSCASLSSTNSMKFYKFSLSIEYEVLAKTQI